MCILYMENQRLTWVGDTDPNISALEWCAGKLQRLFQAVKSAELDVSEAFRLPLQFVLYDAHMSDITSAEEILNVALCSIKRQVAQMRSIRRLRREGKLLANCVATVGC